ELVAGTQVPQLLLETGFFLRGGGLQVLQNADDLVGLGGASRSFDPIEPDSPTRSGGRRGADAGCGQGLPWNGDLGDPAGLVTSDGCLEAGDIPLDGGPGAGARARNQQIDHNVVGADLQLGVVLPVAVGIEKDFHDLFFPEMIVAILHAAPGVGIAAGEGDVEIGV